MKIWELCIELKDNELDEKDRAKRTNVEIWALANKILPDEFANELQLTEEQHEQYDQVFYTAALLTRNENLDYEKWLEDFLDYETDEKRA